MPAATSRLAGNQRHSGSAARCHPDIQYAAIVPPSILAKENVGSITGLIFFIAIKRVTSGSAPDPDIQGHQ
jgi:hypothetical protein